MSRKRIIGGKNVDRHVMESTSSFPWVSVITVIRNAGSHLEKVIDSVQRQTYPYREHIIIDGGSKDDTLAILKENDEKIDYWLSERDEGVYDAMNKGISVSRGEWIYFLGADDVFYGRDSLEVAFKDRIIDSSVVMVMGDVIRADGRRFRNRFNKSLYFKNTVHHQGVFYRRIIFSRFQFGRSYPGRLRPYSISGDYQLNLRLFLQGARHIHMKNIVARCGNGISTKGNKLGYIEEIFIRHEYIGFLRSCIFDIFTMLRYLYKKTTIAVGKR